MRKRNVVINTLSEEVLSDIESKLEDLGVSIIEERYDLLHHRYEIYVRTNLRQGYKLRHFVKSLDVNIMVF